MRIIGNIPHPKLTITVFSMNDKYVVKLEAGPMEQVYKFKQSEVKGMEEIQKIMDEEFLNKCIERFNAMYLDMTGYKSKSNLH